MKSLKSNIVEVGRCAISLPNISDGTFKVLASLEARTLIETEMVSIKIYKVADEVGDTFWVTACGDRIFPNLKTNCFKYWEKMRIFSTPSYLTYTAPILLAH